jgi:hypothetical protein
VSLLVAAAPGQVQCLQRITSGRLVEVFRETLTLDPVPWLAVLLGEQLIGGGGIQELLAVVVPAQFASCHEGDVAQERRSMLRPYNRKLIDPWSQSLRSGAGSTFRSDQAPGPEINKPKASSSSSSANS